MSRNGKSNDQHGAVAKIGLLVVSGAVGVAGGVLLGRTALQRNRKLLGIQLPNKVELSGVSQSISEAGRQLGRLASEMKTVREKAEQIGKVLT